MRSRSAWSRRDLPRPARSGTASASAPCTRSTTPAAPQRLESEAFLRILFGNRGTKQDLLNAIRRLEEDATAIVSNYTTYGAGYARGEGQFPERIHVNALIASLAIAQGRATARWAQWAREQIEAWDDTAVPDVDWAVQTLLQAIGEEDVA
jgi:PadR family transcriptional regulator, regulatory protein AphA